MMQLPDSYRKELLKFGLNGTAAGLAAGGFSLSQAEKTRAAAIHPYGFVANGLDVEYTRQLGYNGYKGITIDGVTHKHCAFATFYAIISQLAEIVGSPYSEIPPQMMEWANGGVAGFGSFCGALNGACAAVGLICSNDDAKGFISDLLSWYAETPLPSNIIAPTGILPQSVAKGNLCHMSVTNWCLASGYASGSSARSERCARLAGDVAAKAVKMLNFGRLGRVAPGDKTTCRVCHYKGNDCEGDQFSRGKMNCTAFHDEFDDARQRRQGPKNDR